MEGDVRVTVVATEFDENWTGNVGVKVAPRSTQQGAPTTRPKQKTKDIPTIHGGSKGLGTRAKPEKRRRGGLPGFFEGN